MKDKLTGVETKKFRLDYGCIRQDNSITSRDSGLPEYFDTEQDAASFMKERARFYASVGCKPWAVSLHERIGDGPEFRRVECFNY